MINTYSVKHKRKTNDDLKKNIDRFTFRYKNKQYEVTVDDNMNVVLDPEALTVLPEKVIADITQKTKAIMRENFI